MVMRRLGLLFGLFFGFLASCLAAQGGANENIFTISVAAPTSPKDVQVRYFLTGDFGVYSSSTTARGVDNKIAIRSVDEAKSRRTLKAIVYAPGCQFVTIRVDDLAASSREVEFQCQKLPTTQVRAADCPFPDLRERSCRSRSFTPAAGHGNSSTYFKAPSRPFLCPRRPSRQMDHPPFSCPISPRIRSGRLSPMTRRSCSS